MSSRRATKTYRAGRVVVWLLRRMEALAVDMLGFALIVMRLIGRIGLLSKLLDSGCRVGAFGNLRIG